VKTVFKSSNDVVRSCKKLSICCYESKDAVKNCKDDVRTSKLHTTINNILIYNS
jgi:hypothetical protein